MLGCIRRKFGAKTFGKVDIAWLRSNSMRLASGNGYIFIAMK